MPTSPKHSSAGRSGSVKEPFPEQLELDFARFKSGGGALDFTIDAGSDTIWATPGQIADLYGTSAGTVVDHIAAIYAEGELPEETTRRPRPGPARETGRGPAPVEDLYDLDVILSVGYRISAVKATAFRKWAARTLRAVILDGYVINEARLREDRDSGDGLAARLRAIRAAESNVYESVRAFFEAAADDYDAASDRCADFARMLRSKFVFAATGETMSDLILERADHAAPNMGMRSFAGAEPSIADARIAANYLDKDELYILHTLCEQFLLFIEAQARRGRTMTMRELGAKLDQLLRLEDYPVLAGNKDFHKERAIRHAQAEYARFIMRARPDAKALGHGPAA